MTMTPNTVGPCGRLTIWMATLLVTCCSQAAELSELAGVWRLQGYGRMFEISARSVVTYDVTDISCLATQEQTLEEAAPEWLDVVRYGTGYSFLRPAGITRYVMEPVGELPAHCRAAAERIRDPMLNFWVLWHMFRENYAFFEMRGVDWQAQYVAHRSRLRFDSSDQELYETFTQMLGPLHDRHVVLKAQERTFRSAGIGELETLWGREHGLTQRESIMASYRPAVRQYVTQRVLRGKFSDAAALTWGWIAPGIGYINVATMSYNQLSEILGTRVSQLEFVDRMDRAMEQAVEQLRGARALIVDARFNDGGAPVVGLRLAGHLVEQRHRAFTKQARWQTGYTQAQDVYIEPSGKRPFTGPVVYLQSGTTCSAAEVFSLVMTSLPQVTRVGTPTYGVLSAASARTLPNGWEVSFANELLLSVDGKSYEGSGVPPHVRIPTPPEDSFARRLDRDVEMALALLAEH